MTEYRKKWQVLGVVGTGTFVMALNTSMMNIAVPFIGAYFSARMPVVEWVLMAFLLVISTLLLPFGRLGDMYGFKRIYLLGIVVFAAGSVLCGMAPSIFVLIAFRILQGIGAAMVMAVSSAIITAAFPPWERGKALGFLGVFVASALGFGPVFGGLLLNWTGWRMLFFINVPLCAIVIAWSCLLLAPRSRTQQAFDLPGAIALFFALGALLVALSHGEEWGWGSVASCGLLTFAAVSFSLFIWRELTCTTPMVELRFFKNRLFSAAAVSAVISFVVQYMVVFLLPFYFKDVLLLDAARAGMLLSSLPLVVLLVSPLSGTLSDRIGSRGLSSIGMAVCALSLVLLSRLTPQSGLFQVVFPLVLLGLGNGIFQSPNNSALMGSVPRTHLGIAGGILAAARNAGMVMGVALAGAVFNHCLPKSLAAATAAGVDETLLPRFAFTGALHDTLLVGAFVACIGMVTSLVRGKPEKAAGLTQHSAD
ncbi:MAG TPA: DHA2 family efflux MFS transporter permease subunit [Desulfotomaculum sp.]|nr:DHA2 family efflux MFS transporter permease subunit [Desulfotomaculum sp.]